MPGASMPVSKPPPSAVAVWVTGSRLVQVTLSPRLIVVADGAKAKLWIVTSWLAASAADGGSRTIPSATAAAQDGRVRAIR